MVSKACCLVLLTIFCAFLICNAGGALSRPKFIRKLDEHEHDEKHGDSDDQTNGKLKKFFYKESCPNAEDIVRKIVTKHVDQKPTMAAKLLRLHYHDCFVRGCDGSILLDSTPGSQSEKEARPNLTLEGYDVIDEIKTEIESQCDQIVSCADILALAARDAVSFQFGKPMWKVRTGRRDGVVSSASEALLGLPSPFFNFSALVDNFALNGLSIHDLVTLSGAHTIGVAHCGTIQKRLFNFTGQGGQDPSIETSYAKTLKAKCQNPKDTTTTLEMDPDSFTSFDNHYYVNLKGQKGLFQSDAALLTNNQASGFVQDMLKKNNFFEQFAISVQRMGAIKVLSGGQGQIRKKCNVVNS
ncbi:hypothetical protein RND81_01G151400 [Saponaria officinalis]|uniref:Peroxidase n=1 Tax=Saponaria officinalis TaxID=3572 RepID=A0AAW1NFH8_SAPOF